MKITDALKRATFALLTTATFFASHASANPTQQAPDLFDGESWDLPPIESELPVTKAPLTEYEMSFKQCATQAVESTGTGLFEIEEQADGYIIKKQDSSVSDDVYGPVLQVYNHNTASIAFQDRTKEHSTSHLINIPNIDTPNNAQIYAQPMIGNVSPEMLKATEKGAIRTLKALRECTRGSGIIPPPGPK